VGPIGYKNQDDNHEAFTTKRNISSFSGVFVLAGIIIGSGIFISPNGVFVAANNSVGVTLLIWLFGGVVAMLSTLCYCELATSIPESGSDYTYLSYAYTPALGFLLPWMYTFVPCSDAALVLTFAQYAVEPYFVGSKPPELALKLVAICLLFFITAINMCSVRWAVRLQVLLSWFKFIAISAVVISAIVFCIGDNSVAKHNFAGAFNKKTMEGITILTLSRSFYQVMFSYDGWNSLCQITEEIQEPGKTIPKASIAAVAIVTLTYVIINCAYFLVLSADEMTSSKIVALPFALKAMGGASWIVPLAVCLCTAGSYSGGVLTSGRSSYVAARRGHFPRIFAMLHINQYTPSPALFLNTIGSIVLIGIGQFNTLIDTFGFVTWTFIGFSSLSVLVLRVRRPDLVKPYKVPTLIPILMILISLLFVILPVISNPHFLYAYAICFFALGELFYFVFVYKGYTIPYYLKSTLFLQKLFLVAPEERKIL
uniref:Cationic amino acid transporter C-terminal domain-containing protein n=1 Tax=Ciona savignyi TaxID=51511 RepID=H2ZHS1_CIOSA